MNSSEIICCINLIVFAILMYLNLITIRTLHKYRKQLIQITCVRQRLALKEAKINLLLKQVSKFTK